MCSFLSLPLMDADRVAVEGEALRLNSLTKGKGAAVEFLCTVSFIFERVSDMGRTFKKETKEHMNKYAEAGLRTLANAYRQLREEDFKDWEEQITKAKTSVNAAWDDRSSG